MRKKKSKIKFILILLFIIIIIIIIFPKNKSVSATYGRCPDCNRELEIHAINRRYHEFWCPNCNHYLYGEEHKGGSHENYGRCVICGMPYQEHHERTEYERTPEGHRIIKLCEEYDEIRGSNTYCISNKFIEHFGGNHENGGICQAVDYGNKFCQYKYQNHAKSTNIVNYSKTRK